MKKILSVIIITIFIACNFLQIRDQKNYIKADSLSDTNDNDLGSVCSKTLYALSESIKDPDVGTTGGDWSVICLARGENPPAGSEYFDHYLKNAEKSIKQMSESSGRNNGSLHRAKSTENSRIILALGAIGTDPQNISGINIVKPLEDLEWVKKQGINGVIYALIAIDSCSYPYPDELHEKLINMILDNQLSDNGWSLDSTSADPDITAAAVQALSGYTYRPEISSAVNKGIACLSSLYKKYFENESIRNSETLSQIITACSCTGIDPDTDSAFIYNGVSVLSELLSYYDPESCFFRHIKTGNSNSMATDQALIALISYERMRKGMQGIFDMNEINNYSPYPEVTGTSLDIHDGLKLRIYLKSEENSSFSAVKLFSITAGSELFSAESEDIICHSVNRHLNIISVPIKYSCLNDILEIRIYHTDPSYYESTEFSINNYLHKVISSTDDENIKNISSYLIELGADLSLYAANSSSANQNISPDSDENTSVPEFVTEEKPVIIMDIPDSIKYLGTDMTIDSNIKVRHRFQSDDPSENVGDSTDNSNSGNIFFTEYILNDTGFYKGIENKDQFGIIYFSATDYLSNVWRNTQNIYLKKLCCSLYNYEKSVYDYHTGTNQ